MSTRPTLDQALDLAIERGTLTADQGAAVRDIERQIATREPADDESLRFITGFADIFVTIGIGLFEGALGFLVASSAGATAAFASLAAAAWLLAEVFTARGRMALPSIVLLLVFVASVFGLVLSVVGGLPAAPTWLVFTTTAPRAGTAAYAMSALATAGAAAVHYWRFRVPITIAAGAAALCVLAVSMFAALLPDVSRIGFDALLLACGVGVFALAMTFDLSDPARVTRRTDIAFWLHLLAAPLIVHPILHGFFGGLRGTLPLEQAWGTLAVFLVLAVVAVTVDRRAVLVSGLVYAGFAFSRVADSIGLTSAQRLPSVVALALGAFVLILSAGWHPLRRATLRALPKRLARRLPHPLVPA